MFDPLRKTEVADTPEEKVRQWFISILKDTSEVPLHLMMSEVPLNFANKKYRADILVYDRNAKPLAVVECKRPEVELGPEVVRQAMRYNIVLGVDWLILTNGGHTYIYVREGDEFKPYGSVPSYETMLCQRAKSSSNT